MGVFLGIAQPVNSHAAPFCFVVQHHARAASKGVDAVDLANQGEVAQRHVLGYLAVFKRRAGCLMLCQPGQIAFAHTRPDGSKRQKLAVAQPQLCGGRLSRYVNHSYSRPKFGRRSLI